MPNTQNLVCHEDKHTAIFSESSTVIKRKMTDDLSQKIDLALPQFLVREERPVKEEENDDIFDFLKSLLPSLRRLLP